MLERKRYKSLGKVVRDHFKEHGSGELGVGMIWRLFQEHRCWEHGWSGHVINKVTKRAGSVSQSVGGSVSGWV